MPESNVSTIYSAGFKDMQDSVNSAKKNKIILDKISKIYNFKNIIQFPMSFLRKYENILKSNLSEINLETQYKYRPEYLSYALYNTTDLWYLLLFVNDMKDPIEFCTPTVKIPSSNFIMEIVNRLKLLESDSEASQENPIQIDRHLIKDINFSSDNIIKSDNSFINKINYNYQDATDDMIHDENGNLRDFTITNYILCESYATNKDNSEIKASNSVSLPIYIDNDKIYSKNKTYYAPISLPTNNLYTTNNNLTCLGMKYKKYLEKNTNYILLKRYNGDSTFLLTNNDKTKRLTKNLAKKTKVNFNNIIASYDMREASFSPEYLIHNLYLEYKEEKYYPELLEDNNGDEYYGLVIDNLGYEIFFDGTKYYINKDKTIYELITDYENNKNIFHSMNEWEFNLDNQTTAAIDTSEDFFNEEFSKDFGNYVYTCLNIKDNYKKGKMIKIKINLKRDLSTNNIDLNDYQFLGFNFYYLCSNLTNDIKFSPLKIELLCDENNEEKLYTFSLPYFKDFNSEVYTTSLNNKGYQVSNIKRIIPIVHNFKDKKSINIKEIYVSFSYESEDDDNDISLSIGGVEINGFKSEDLVEEFILPDELDSDYYNIEYDYEYKYIEKGIYFEPYIFKSDEDLLEKTSDNEDTDDINKKTSYEIKTKNIPWSLDRNQNKYCISTYRMYEDNQKPIYSKAILNKFLLDDNYKLTLKFSTSLDPNLNLGTNIQEEQIVEENNYSKNYTNTAFSILFDILNNDTSYFINFGEEYLNYNYNIDPEKKTMNNREPKFTTEKCDLAHYKLINSNEKVNEVSKKANIVFYDGNYLITKYLPELIRKNNEYYIMPDGLYKAMDNGSNTYKIYKNIEDLNIKCFPMKQSTTLSDIYFETSTNIDSYTPYSIFIKIEKINSNITIYYKNKEEDDFKILYYINDYYQLLKNGQFGFISYMLNTFSSITLLSYEIPSFKNK